jgi:hypothetical protein
MRKRRLTQTEYGLTRILNGLKRIKIAHRLRKTIFFVLLLMFLPLDKIILFSLYPHLSVLNPHISVVAHTGDAKLNQEIQKGREIVEKFYRGEVKCQNLTNEDFHSVGEYVMEQIVGGSDHLTMNKMIEEMHGKEGEELMHINMGKRFLGCDGDGKTSIMGGGMPMMGYWGFWNWRGWNFLAPIFGIVGILWLLVILSFPILVLILLILGIIYLIKKLKSEIRRE